MLWIKAFHIVFVISWFAGLLYLPRLFVYHVQAAEEGDAAGCARFVIMERRLYRIMTVGAVGTLLFGLWLLAGWWMSSLQGSGWMHLKLLLVAGLLVFHAYLWHCARRFAAGANAHGERFYRIVNEVPALTLIAIVILVVVKPF